MKAAFLIGHGGNEVVAVGERPAPRRSPGEILIRMRAATVNRVDLYMRDSGAGITHTLPQIMGVDGAGVIEEADSGALIGRRVTLYPGIVCGDCDFCKRGDPVLCAKMSLLGEHRDGTMAEFVCVPADNGLAVPDNLDFAQAAALGVNYLTAWRMLFTKAKLQRGETVLVFGVGGGVSLAALQIAKAAGARVLATSRSAKKLSRATELGADATVNAPPDGITKEVMGLTQGRGVRCSDREYRRTDLERSLEMPRSRRSNCHMRRNDRRSTAGRSATHLYPAIADFWFDPWESR